VRDKVRDDTAPLDGRTARSHRTRRAIVDALLALLNEGDLKPTAERIAERAGVSLRSLWTNFRDMESLFGAAGERLIQHEVAEYQPIPATLPLPQRIAEFCRQRARILELIAPVATAAAAREPFSAQLRRNRARELARVRAEICELFAPEVDAAGPGRDRLVDALIVSSTFAAWSTLRGQLGLAPEEATDVMLRMVNSLLVAALAAGAH
jgi:AcrR family transcriptional regulator